MGPRCSLSFPGSHAFMPVRRHPLVEAWSAAYSQGIGPALCDRIVQERDVPPRLAGAVLYRPTETLAGKKVYRLTRRERQVLYLVSVGWGDGNVAKALGISIWTEKGYWRSIIEKLGARTRPEAVAIGIREFEII